MASPFPGMDPYLESPAHWSDFHARFVPALADAINQRLPRNYVARLDEHVSLIAPVREVPGGDVFIPDVAVLQRPGPAPASPGGGAALLVTPEPVTLENVEFQDERTEAFIRIVRLPEQELVTVIELLSPTNKYGGGRGEYVQKRRDFLRQPVNLVELDLLRAGVRLQFARPMPPGHYFALVTRAGRPGLTDAYPWTVRDRMPAIPIPLRAPDPDVTVGLAEPFGLSYERGRYGELIDYAKPPPPPAFAGGNAGWAAETALAGVRST